MTNMVSKLLRNGALSPSVAHNTTPDTIPFPMPLVRDITLLKAEDDIKIIAYST